MEVKKNAFLCWTESAEEIIKGYFEVMKVEFDLHNLYFLKQWEQYGHDRAVDVVQIDLIPTDDSLSIEIKVFEYYLEGVLFSFFIDFFGAF